MTSDGFCILLTVVPASIKKEKSLPRGHKNINRQERKGIKCTSKGNNMMVCRQCWSPWEPTETTGIPMCSYTKWILWKCTWITLSSTCLITIFIVALPLVLANLSQFYVGRLSNFISYLMWKSRFVGISVHTQFLFTKTQDFHNHILKSGMQKKCLSIR